VIATGVFSRQLIGRSRELAFLVDRARNAPSGGMIVVRGEAGIGKTRLVNDFAALARQHGKRVAFGAAREFANGPYGELVEALLTLGVQTLPPPEQPGGEGKSTWYAAVTEALRNAIVHAPGGAVIVLDDLHWADSATIDLLQFASTRLAEAPVLFVVTYRNDEIESDTSRARALASLERNADVITLQPLPPGQIEHLIVGVLRNIGRRVAPDVVAEVRDLSDGRPFFAEELLRGVLERLQRDENASPTVPTSLRATVRERYASLDPTAREVLLHAAVFGRRFSALMVSELLGIDLAIIYSSLRHARDLQLIVEDERDDDGDSFAFRHALTREAVYGEMLRAEARIVHGRVATLLAARPSVRPAEIAEHTWRARSGDDAALWNERAGDAAFALYAYGDAARHYERAFRCSRQEEQLARVSERAAEAYYAIGDVASSETWYAHAADANRKLGRTSYTARLSLKRARILSESGRSDEGLAEADRVAHGDGSVEPALRFEAEVYTAGVLAGQGRPLEALQRLQLAEAIGADVDLAVKTVFYATYAHVSALIGKPTEARSYFSETLANAQSAGNADMVLRTYNNWGSVELMYGTVRRASELYGAALKIAASMKHLRHTVWLTQNSALAAIISGDLDAADDFLKQGGEIDHGVAVVQRWSLALRLRLATLRASDNPELLSEALQYLEEARTAADVSSVHILAGVIALHLESRGAAAEALPIVAVSATSLETAIAPYWILDVATRSGDHTLRTRARLTLEQIAGRTDALAAQGFLAMADAREAQRQRDRERMSHRGSEAAAAFAQAGWRLEEAFALEVAGHIGEALSRFREIGAVAEVRRLTESSAAPRRRGDSTLTAREREVAGLVAAGKSAKAIAEALVISERTVESHIAATYRKLGVSGRSALAALLDATDE
jgi:DNA-binding CsgD family transcriptional regulator/tetratricopeptide (TPR) repeat protein